MHEVIRSLAELVVRLCRTWLGYLSGNHFPHPFSEEDEARHLAALRMGDTRSRDELIKHNLRLVAHIVKKFDPDPQEVEDLISIGSIGLVKAIDTYKEDKGTRLATYASKCIENEILMYLRATRGEKTECHLYDSLSSEDDDGEVSFMDIVHDVEEPDILDTVASKIEAEKISSYLSILDPREMRVVEMRFGLGGREPMTQREVAKKLGISRSYVSRIEKRALMKLADHIQDQKK